MKRRVARGSNSLAGCQSAAIHCRFSSRSSVVVLPYFVRNQSNMCRKTMFGCFMRISSYISRIALCRFARKTSERVAFMVTMSALVFWSRALVALSVSRSLSELHAEKSGIESTSAKNRKQFVGYVSFVKKVRDQVTQRRTTCSFWLKPVSSVSASNGRCGASGQ